MIKVLDVVWVIDEFIKPPAPKMWVCVETSLGLYYRINTEPKWQISVPISQARNAFLTHDSHLECGSPLEVDDYIIEQSIRRRGIHGRLDPYYVPSICDAVTRSRNIRDSDRAAILAALKASIP